uniref:hypothetical protein n=1 Tax=Streptococcus iniae TaxID=1346 RepID=UPI0035C6D14B
RISTLKLQIKPHSNFVILNIFKTEITVWFYLKLLFAQPLFFYCFLNVGPLKGEAKSNSEAMSVCHKTGMRLFPSRCMPKVYLILAPPIPPIIIIA